MDRLLTRTSSSALRHALLGLPFQGYHGLGPQTRLQPFSTCDVRMVCAFVHRLEPSNALRHAEICGYCKHFAVVLGGPPRTVNISDVKNLALRPAVFTSGSSVISGATLSVDREECTAIQTDRKLYFTVPHRYGSPLPTRHFSTPSKRSRQAAGSGTAQFDETPPRWCR